LPPDWDTPQPLEYFLKSEAHDTVLGRLGQVFDLKAAPPFIARFEWDSFESALTAFRSGVTEIAFVSLPNNASNEARRLITEESDYEDVQRVGKATGATNGWGTSESRPLK